MNKKQTTRLYLALGAVLVGTIFSVYGSSNIAHADPATTSVVCMNGKSRTASKTSKPPGDILNDKDYQYACRNDKGYTPPKPITSGGGTTTGTTCGGVDTAIIKCDADNSGDITKNGVWALLILVINIMTAGVGVLAVGGIVYGSILYTTAEDKADQVKKATDIITNVIIGLVAFALMWAGLNFIIPGGVFS
jgi:hypothetical protein